MQTLTQGRIDIVIFPNGGWERLGYVPANPEIPEEVWYNNILEFVANNQNLPKPQKFTGYYGMSKTRSNAVEMSWGEYQGDMPDLTPQFDPMAEIQRAEQIMQEQLASLQAPPEAIDVEPPENPELTEDGE